MRTTANGPSGLSEQTSGTGASAPITWSDLPPQPWPEATVAPVEALADWLLSLSREQFLYVLSGRQDVWGEESRCFVLNHDGEVERLRDWQRKVTNVLRKHGIDPFAVAESVCPRCHGPRMYVEVHDSYACVGCNIWLEAGCGCDRCEARPLNPTPVTFGGRVGSNTTEGTR